MFCFVCNLCRFDEPFDFLSAQRQHHFFENARSTIEQIVRCIELGRPSRVHYKHTVRVDDGV